MYRYFIYLSFDGRAYHGWQIQPNGITVEEALDQLRAAIDEYRLQYPELFGKAK